MMFSRLAFKSSLSKINLFHPSFTSLLSKICSTEEHSIGKLLVVISMLNSYITRGETLFHYLSLTLLFVAQRRPFTGSTILQ